MPHFLRIVRARVSPSPLNRYPASHVALLACAQSNSERPFYSLTKLRLYRRYPRQCGRRCFSLESRSLSARSSRKRERDDRSRDFFFTPMCFVTAMFINSPPVWYILPCPTFSCALPSRSIAFMPLRSLVRVTFVFLSFLREL